jgi:hypothetical protein
MKKYILFILMIVSILACTKTLDFDDEGLANKLVFNGIIQTGDSFNANLSRSSSILSETGFGIPPMPAEGTIQLFENETLLSTTSSSFGKFSLTNIKPKAGANYRIVVNTENDMIEAQTTIPEKVAVLSIDTATVSLDTYSKKLAVRLKIKDSQGDDYYRIVYMKETISYIDDNKGGRKYYKNYTQSGIRSDDPVFKSVYNNFGDEIIDGPENEYGIFPDNYFNGKEYVLKFSIYQDSYSYGNNPSYGGYGDPSVVYGASRQIYERNEIHIQKLSKDLYNYLKYLKLYNFYHDNPFAEPVPVYSNIKNGIGIFAGFNDEVKLEYEKKLIPFSMDTIKIEEGGSGYGGGYTYQ